MMTQLADVVFAAGAIAVMVALIATVRQQAGAVRSLYRQMQAETRPIGAVRLTSLGLVSEFDAATVKVAAAPDRPIRTAPHEDYVPA